MFQSVSYVAAAIGVFVAAIFYVMTLRMTRRNMRITLTNSLMQSLLSEESFRIYFELLNMEWKDYDDFERKYGSDVGLDNVSKRHHLWSSYDALGNLLKSGLADVETLYSAGTDAAIWVWAKFKPIIEENRRRYSGKDAWQGFEYLATEMMRLRRERDPSYKIPETFAKYVPDN